VKALAASAAAIVLCGVAAACSSSSSGTGSSTGSTGSTSSTGSTKGQIVIGIADDLSSFEASSGKAVQAAWTPLAQQANAAGGINGRQVKVISLDTQAMPANVITDVKELASDGATIITGLSDSNQCAAAQPADTGKIPLICAYGTPAQIIPTSPFIFVRNPTEIQEMLPLNSVLKKQFGTVHYGLMPLDLAGELAWSSYMKQIAAGSGGTSDQQILPLSGSVTAQVASILQAKPNAIIMEAAEADTDTAITQLLNAGYTGDIVSLTLYGGSLEHYAYPNLYEYNTATLYVPGATPAVDAMTKALASQGVTGVTAVNGTDQVQDYLSASLGFTALKACAGCNGAALEKALEIAKTNLPGIAPQGGYGYSASSHVPIENIEAYVYDKASKSVKLSYSLPLTAPADVPASAVSG
jgi:ABC-type branched-subunit amino acid transport system substrate-binding protein